MIVVTGSVRAGRDNVEAVREACIAHSMRSRGEGGCLSHNVHVDCEDPLRFFFFERWADRATLEAHFAMPGTALLLATLRALGAAGSRPHIYDVAEEATP